MCGPARDGFASARGAFDKLARYVFDALAFLDEARGDRLAAHFGARARRLERRDLIFEDRFERAQSGKGAVETRIERIKLATYPRGPDAPRCAMRSHPRLQRGGRSPR